MNKIIINQEESIFHFKDNTIIDELEIDCNHFHSTWIIDDNGILDIRILLTIKNIDGDITIISNQNTELVCYMGIISSLNNHFILTNLVEGNHNKSDIKVRVIGEKEANTFLKTTGNLYKNTNDNIYSEDVRYLNEWDSHITCLPELIVSSNDVVANHNMTVRAISDEELFYLESKGLKKASAKKMLRYSFVTSLLRKE